MDQQSSIDEVQAPITTAPPQVRRIIELVLEVEKDKLYQKYPRSILSIAQTTTTLLCKHLTLFVCLQSNMRSAL